MSYIPYEETIPVPDLEEAERIRNAEKRDEQILSDIDSALECRQQIKLWHLAVQEILEEGDNGIPWAEAVDHPFPIVAEESCQRLAAAIQARAKQLLKQ